MLIVFILSGLLTNLSVIFLVNILNTTLSPQYFEWANSQGITVLGKIQLFGLSGGGASGAIMGLLGFSMAISCTFMILLIVKIVQNVLKSDISEIKQIFYVNRYLIAINLITLLFVIVTFPERFIADLEMFSYSLTHLYAFGSGTGIEFPQSRGHPILAHVIGAIIGFILGLWYLVFSNKSILQPLELSS
jgi:hypothetical protein